jgi:hypothetical protein
MNRSRPIVRVHTAKVNLISIIFRLAIIIVATTFTPLVASAQQNPLIGTWQLTGPSIVYTTTYYPSGKWFMEIATGPMANGSGAGVIRQVGTYQSSGYPDLTLRVLFGAGVICPAGNGCMPYGRSPLFAPGTRKVFHLKFQGPDKVLGEDGSISVRIR